MLILWCLELQVDLKTVNSDKGIPPRHPRLKGKRSSRINKGSVNGDGGVLLLFRSRHESIDYCPAKWLSLKEHYYEDARVRHQACRLSQLIPECKPTSRQLLHGNQVLLSCFWCLPQFFVQSAWAKMIGVEKKQKEASRAWESLSKAEPNTNAVVRC